ncbi:MAG: hypothetical protein RL386_654 [Bacteroidota bacterium]|jgi:cytosine/adenosine deaminase-related metal-dependent hydrolase
MRKISADFICPVNVPPIAEGVLITDDDGRILAIDPSRSRHDPATLEVSHGIIVPGFVNTHCHLELSHLKGRVATGTSLLPFLYDVVALRESEMEEILAAIASADAEMFEGGIVAVGDISNKADTAALKDRSRLRYYTFVEMFDFLQDNQAEGTFARYYEVFGQQSTANGNQKSCVPHAPYTVSRKLFAKTNAANRPGQTISIHNQETPHENTLFQDKSGAFIDFYARFGFSLDHFQPVGKTSIHYAMENLRQDTRVLFVHNTTTSPADIHAAQAWNPQVYWATCPNANLYIENRLPVYRNFIDAGAKVTIGTDSLTSNWQLSVLEEMKTIARLQSYVPFDAILRWATLNGAEALGFERDFGSLEPGKKPGVLLLEGIGPSFRLTAGTTVRRLL